MKKTIAILSLSALMLVSGTAFAKDNSNDNDGRGWGLGLGLMHNEHHAERSERKDMHANLGENMFVLVGEIKSISSSSFVVSVQRSSMNNDLNGKDITVKTDSETNFKIEKNDSEFSDLVVGQTVMVKGEKSDSTYTADWVKVHGKKKMSFGEVTATADGSVTIKNNTTGEVTTIPVNDDTKVMINGEVKTTDDIKVGDKGMFKLKALLNDFVAKFVVLFR